MKTQTSFPKPRDSNQLGYHRNIGVLQTTVAELVTVKEQQREYSD